MLLIILSIIFCLIDYISKYIVIHNMTIGSSIKIIKNFFYLTYINNEGAAFSILEGKQIFLIIISIITIAILLYYIRKKSIKDKLTLISISLLIGGSLGNLIDRITRGYVIDFLDFHIFGYNFPVFNIADTMIVIGVLLLFLLSYRKDKKL